MLKNAQESRIQVRFNIIGRRRAGVDIQNIKCTVKLKSRQSTPRMANVLDASLDVSAFFSSLDYFAGLC